MLTVVITGVGFPGDEGQGRVAAAQAADPTPRAEHVHLDRLGRQLQQARDFLALPMLGDQAQDLPLTRGQPFEAEVVAGVHHGAKMGRRSRSVQPELHEHARLGRDPSKRSLWPGAKACQAWDRTNGKRVVGVFEIASKALATAGPITGVPGSPTPLGAAPDGTMWVSTVGASLIRNTR